MSVSEQVSRLRYVANGMEIGSYGENILIDMLNEAADTIESLSAKLADMERSAEDCGDGWIYCGDGKNLPEIERDVLLSTRGLDVYKGYRADTEGYFYTEEEGYILCENVLAWMPQPKPYHEP